ncbi:hypothetical protein ACFQE0_21440 [Methylobacterium komagatae]|uniref:Uncharacterized protein n=1 Tax=Methylobacterium komagatae TaxID=374425 RepID=A0ABW2BNB4_9HYPH
MSPSKQLWQHEISSTVELAKTFSDSAYSTEEDRAVIRHAISLLEEHCKDLEGLSALFDLDGTIPLDAIYAQSAKLAMATALIFGCCGISDSSRALNGDRQAAVARGGKVKAAEKHLRMQKEVLAKNISDWHAARAHPHTTAESILVAVNRDLKAYDKSITSRSLQDWIKRHAPDFLA